MFVHLRLHTEYSLENGLTRIEKKKSPSPLMGAVEQGGMAAVAVTDLGNLFAAVKFYRAATGAGIKPIFGTEVRIHPEEESGLESRLVLLAQNDRGFKNIKTLLSRSFIEGQRRGVPQLDRAWFGGLTDGIIALSGGRSGDVGQATLAGEPEEAEQRLRFWMEHFPERFYLELQRTERSGDEHWIHAAVALAAEHQLPVVATNDVHFLLGEEFDAHEARVCIHDGRVLDDPRRPKHFTAQQYLKSAEEMETLFADIPEAIENSVEIAKRCNVELSLGKNYLPDFPIPEGMTIEQFFNKESEEGLEQRLLQLFETPERIAEKRAPYDERLQIELEVINGMGFPGYFLIVADFIRWSKENGIPVGPGRGSGAGSLVAYALLITDLDPLEYELLFERFLNPERVSMPDFDVDFCMDRRDEVIRYVAETYGIDRVSQIITYGRMNAKAVVRDVGRVQGHPYGMVDRVAKLIPFDLGMTLDKALEESEELRERYEEEEDVHELIELARALEGVARNAGKHAGGVVISPSDINDFSPIYCEENGSGLVTQFDKDDVEAVGLVKFDFLGLRTLTIIDWAVEMIDAQRKLQGEQPLDITKISLEDRSAFDLLQASQTTAVFQLESSGMKELIAKLKPDCFEDIVALVALYRPGPLESGMVDNFIDRKHGREELSFPDVKYQHDSLIPILKPTYGVILYQEQVMQIAQVLAGYSLGGADMLRRAMGKKKPEEMEKQRSIFKEGSINNNVDPDLAMKIFDLVEKFAGYGFNKCLTGDTLIADPTTGALRTMASLIDGGLSSVASLQSNQQLDCSVVADIMENGVKPVFELTTSLGKKLRATGNHPLLTFNGWRQLDELKVGDRIASPRRIPVEGKKQWSQHELIVLGWMLSEGNTCHPSGFYFYNQDTAAINDFCLAVECFENTQSVRTLREERANTWQVYVKAAGERTAKDRLGRPALARSGARVWLESLQMVDVGAAEKTFPAPVFELDNHSLALLIGRYWSGDGFIFSETNRSRNTIPYAATASYQLAQQLQHLLLRLGIVSRVTEKQFPYREGRTGYTVHLVGRHSTEQFMEKVAPHMAGREEVLEQLRHYLRRVPEDRESIDTLPPEIKQWVQQAKECSGVTWKQVEQESGVCIKEFYGGEKPHKKGFRRSTIGKLGTYFKDERLLQAANAELFWERIESITPDGMEMTYDLEVDTTHNFVANDLIVHNSHSAAYALVSYQTAWLKAHYPAPFMAAVLSADMDNTDKVVTLIEECRSMELVVHSPGINRSLYKFTVLKQSDSERYDVVYGIGAIKGVGEAAIEGIIAEREESGPYIDLFDFCRRIDLRKANKRVMESLIRAGALDEIGPEMEGLPRWELRATLMASLPDAMQAAEQHVRDQERGQGDLFGGSEESEVAVAVSYKEAKPWSEDERLIGERDTLGLYLTGHPIDQHEGELSHIITQRMNRLSSDKDKMVTLAGLLVSMRVVKTRTGKPLAILVLDDRTGRLEMTLFAETYEKYRHLLEKDAILVVQGTVTDDDYTGGLRMNTEELWNLDGARAAYMKRLILKLEQAQLQRGGVAALQRVIQPFCEGHIPVRIHYRQPAVVAKVDMGPDWNVQPSSALFQRLREQLGDGAVEPDYG